MEYPVQEPKCFVQYQATKHWASSLFGVRICNKMFLQVLNSFSPFVWSLHIIPLDKVVVEILPSCKLWSTFLYVYDAHIQFVKPVVNLL